MLLARKGQVVSEQTTRLRERWTGVTEVEMFSHNAHDHISQKPDTAHQHKHFKFQSPVGG